LIVKVEQFYADGASRLISKNCEEICKFFYDQKMTVGAF